MSEIATRKVPGKSKNIFTRQSGPLKAAAIFIPISWCILLIPLPFTSFITIPLYALISLLLVIAICQGDTKKGATLLIVNYFASLLFWVAGFVFMGVTLAKSMTEKNNYNSSAEPISSGFFSKGNGSFDSGGNVIKDRQITKKNKFKTFSHNRQKQTSLKGNDDWDLSESSDSPGIKSDEASNSKKNLFDNLESNPSNIDPKVAGDNQLGNLLDEIDSSKQEVSSIDKSLDDLNKRLLLEEELEAAVLRHSDTESRFEEIGTELTTKNTKIKKVVSSLKEIDQQLPVLMSAIKAAKKELNTHQALLVKIKEKTPELFKSRDALFKQANIEASEQFQRAWPGKESDYIQEFKPIKIGDKITFYSRGVKFSGKFGGVSGSLMKIGFKKVYTRDHPDIAIRASASELANFLAKKKKNLKSLYQKRSFNKTKKSSEYLSVSALIKSLEDEITNEVTTIEGLKDEIKTQEKTVALKSKELQDLESTLTRTKSEIEALELEENQVVASLRLQGEKLQDLKAKTAELKE